MNMIEKIAMAIYNSELEEERSCSWEDLFTGEKVQYRRQARLAIEAMREPTDSQRNNYFKMRKAAGQSDIGACFIDSHWECAIDAALKEDQ